MEIWGWFDLELMLAWKNMFPLTKESRELGYLPLMNKAWVLTPNPWWRFVIDRPAVQAPPSTSSSSSVTSSSVLISEKSLTKVEKDCMEPVITVRKIFQDKPVECFLKGNLHRVKMIQFAGAEIKGTIVTKATIGEMGIVHHSITLF
nr:hypothetical protein CFP56_34577 [Quercus suber]